MKKKILTLILVGLLVFSVSACGKDDPVESTSAPSSASAELSAQPEQTVDTASEGQDTLVAVFSWAGNRATSEDVDIVSSATLNETANGLLGDTQLMGQTAAEVTGGDYFEILCETPYPADEDETYTQAQQEQLDQARPALSTHVENMDNYGTIVLVYPNWWGSLPMPVASFLEEYDFAKKTIIPVCCYEAEDSGSGKSREEISALCDAYVTAGYNLRGNAAATSGTKTDFTNWLEDLPVNF